MIRVFPDRSFEVAEFSSAHALLRLTSAKTESEPYIDLMFRGVAYFDLPAVMPPGLEVLEPAAHDLAFVNSRLPARVPPEKIFVIVSGTRRYRVVAEELKIAESMGGLSESPFPPADLTHRGRGGILP
jgi:hypothetical protein